MPLASGWISTALSVPCLRSSAAISDPAAPSPYRSCGLIGTNQRTSPVTSSRDQQTQRLIIDWCLREPSAALLPRSGRPTCNTSVRVMGKISRSEAFADTHVGIRSGVIALPKDLSRGCIECRHPAAYTEVAPVVADEHAITGHQRCCEQRLATVNRGRQHVPQHIASCGIQRNRVAVESIQEEDRCAAVRAGLASGQREAQCHLADVTDIDVASCAGSTGLSEGCLRSQ